MSMVMFESCLHTGLVAVRVIGNHLRHKRLCFALQEPTDIGIVEITLPIRGRASSKLTRINLSKKETISLF